MWLIEAQPESAVCGEAQPESAVIEAQPESDEMLCVADRSINQKVLLSATNSISVLKAFFARDTSEFHFFCQNPKKRCLNKDYWSLFISMSPSP